LLEWKSASQTFVDFHKTRRQKHFAIGKWIQRDAAATRERKEWAKLPLQHFHANLWRNDWQARGDSQFVCFDQREFGYQRLRGQWAATTIAHFVMLDSSEIKKQ
jgi:hypothetical protein